MDRVETGVTATAEMDAGAPGAQSVAGAGWRFEDWPPPFELKAKD